MAMNANLKLARQFGIATGCGFAVTLNLGLIGATWADPHVTGTHPSAPFVLALVTGGITAALAIVTFALFVAGALEWVFRRKGASENDVEKKS
jgi:hypothetical protein